MVNCILSIFTVSLLKVVGVKMSLDVIVLLLLVFVYFPVITCYTYTLRKNRRFYHLRFKYLNVQQLKLVRPIVYYYSLVGRKKEKFDFDQIDISMFYYLPITRLNIC